MRGSGATGPALTRAKCLLAVMHDAWWEQGPPYGVAIATPSWQPVESSGASVCVCAPENVLDADGGRDCLVAAPSTVARGGAGIRLEHGERCAVDGGGGIDDRDGHRPSITRRAAGNTRARCRTSDWWLVTGDQRLPAAALSTPGMSGQWCQCAGAPTVGCSQLVRSETGEASRGEAR